MATLSKPVGYECEFVDQVPEYYFCKQCKHVAREPNITTCCGECFCKACIDVVIQDKKPCPSCEETEPSSILQRKHQRTILALKVHCMLKERGCEWTGQLQHLDAHLDVTTGDCMYVDIDCPSDCNQKVQKRSVDIHLAKECPNRDSICPHCSLRGTFREVSQHFEVCRYYPLVCPNRCGATFERDDLEDHMKLCGLVKVQCDFSYAGCQAEFLRDNQEKHMEQNTQRHLALMAAATLRITQTFEQKLQEQQEVFDQKLGEQQKQLQEKDEQIHAFEEHQKTLETKIDDQNEQIKTMQAAVKEIDDKHNTLRMKTGMPPYELTITYCQENKDLVSGGFFYTNLGGHKLELKFLIIDAFLMMQVFSQSGENDDKLTLPARYMIMMFLLNQHRDSDHFMICINCKLTDNPHYQDLSVGASEVINLKSDAAEIQYLKDDCIRVRITHIMR